MKGLGLSKLGDSVCLPSNKKDFPCYIMVVYGLYLHIYIRIYVINACMYRYTCECFLPCTLAMFAPNAGWRCIFPVLSEERE